MVVLRSKLSGYYFKEFGVWTSHVLQAMTFSNEAEARAFVVRENVTDVQFAEREDWPGELMAAA